MMRARRMLARFVAPFILMGTAAMAAVPSQVSPTAPPNFAARVDGQPISTLTLDVAWRIAHATDPKATRANVLDTLVRTRLIAVYARKHVGEAALHAGRKVAFEPEVATDHRLAASLRTQFDAQLTESLRSLPGGNLESVLLAPKQPDPKMVEKVVANRGMLRLESVLTPAQIKDAQAVPVLRYAFPGQAPDTITLADVYRRQNVQGRVELLQANLGFIAQQARLEVANRYTVQWAMRQFGKDAVLDLRQMLADQEDARSYQEMHGIGDDIDSESPLLKQFEKRVTVADIHRYYPQHQSEFKRVDRVHTRHIRVADETLAHQITDALAHGTSFESLARKHSIVDADKGGDLGWIVHGASNQWLANIAFMQAIGQPSAAFRAPVGPNDKAYWEILLVDQREESFQRESSDTVRFAATKAIAREIAQRHYEKLGQDLVRSAHVDINQQVLTEPPVKGAT